ncbi:hypothetical protein [Acetobacter sp. UBA5411]|uniref:hypothetical protein n=1 Tax=Acetobacter sp. UBA5411 TaxID=1945905 RepID=UPI0025C44ABB|nr:hypothetical protein [Acetobacter sp. UBA5411]
MQAEKEAGERFYAVFSDRLKQLRTGQDMPWGRISSLTGLEIPDLIRMEEGRPFHYGKYRQFMDGLGLTFAEISPTGIYFTSPFPDVGNTKWGSDVARLVDTLAPLAAGLLKCHDGIEAFRKRHNMLHHTERADLRRRPEMIELGRYLTTCAMLRGTEFTDLHDRIGMKIPTLALLSRGLRDPLMGTLARIGSCLSAPIDCVAPTKASPSGRFAQGLIVHYIQTLGQIAGIMTGVPEVTAQIETLMSSSQPFGPRTSG